MKTSNLTQRFFRLSVLTQKCFKSSNLTQRRFKSSILKQKYFKPPDLTQRLSNHQFSDRDYQVTNSHIQIIKSPNLTQRCTCCIEEHTDRPTNLRTSHMIRLYSPSRLLSEANIKTFYSNHRETFSFLYVVSGNVSQEWLENVYPLNFLFCSRIKWLSLPQLVSHFKNLCVHFS